MNACHDCERTHNRDVREQGRCWCPCHTRPGAFDVDHLNEPYEARENA